MKMYDVTIRVEIDDEDVKTTGEQEVRDFLYGAGGDAPFSFEITSVVEAKT